MSSRRPSALFLVYVGYLALAGVMLWIVDDVAGTSAREVEAGMTPSEVLQRVIGSMMLGSAVPVWIIGTLEPGPQRRRLVGGLAALNAIVATGGAILLMASSLTTAPIVVAQGVFAVAFVVAWRKART